MLVIALWILGILALIQGAWLLARLRAEDPGQWAEVRPPGVEARLRLHPGWTTGKNGEADFRTGVPGAVLRIAELAHAEPAEGDLERRFERLVTGSGLSLDEPKPEPFQAVSGPGVRVASAGTAPDGARGWFEFHLVQGPGRDLALIYRCPVLSGSVDTRTLSRTAESVRFP